VKSARVGRSKLHETIDPTPPYPAQLTFGRATTPPIRTGANPRKPR
jgi:hypothetical protein